MYPYLLWMAGLILPFLYLTYVINFPKILNRLRKKDTYAILIVLFFCFQIFSTFFGFLTPFYSSERYFGIIHNILSFSFLLLGYCISFDNNFRIKLAGFIGHVYVITAILSIVIFYFSWMTQVYISYPNIIGFLFGIQNDIGQVAYSQIGYFMGFEIPRSRILGTFPNTTAILLSMLFAIQGIKDRSVVSKYLMSILLVAAVATTGSRSGVVLSMIFALSNNLKKKGFFHNISSIHPNLPGLDLLWT